MSSNLFLDFIANRRTYYQLAAKSPIPDTRIQKIIENAILNVPSAFNSQTVRIILLVKEDHRKLWDIVKEVLKPVVPEDAFPVTEKKINGFQAAYGTVLFFDHRPTILNFQERFSLYAEKIPSWAIQSNGMHQFAIWTALELEGLGANLQHYNPLIDAKIKSQWDIPDDWDLSGQLVFGTPTGEPNKKTFKPMEERFKTFGV